MGSGASSSSRSGSRKMVAVDNNSNGINGSNVSSNSILDKRLIDHDKNSTNGNNDNNNGNNSDNNNDNNNDNNDNDIYDETRYKDDENNDDDDGHDDDHNDDNDEMFENAALSLEMENDELLFNLLYFSQQSEQQCNNSNQFRNMLNNAFEETVALHSENNTPYKLRPASKDTINSIKSSKYTNDENEKECIVCRDEMELGCEIIKLPQCHHCFHRPCIVRWLELQSFCPICKGQIKENHDNFNHEEKAEDTNNITYQDDDIGI